MVSVLVIFVPHLMDETLLTLIPGTCWLKKSMGSYPSAPNNYISAIRVTNALSSSKSSSASTLATSISSSVPAVSVSSSVLAIPVSSSSAAPGAASASTGLSCPSSNFTTFVDIQGTNWQILCGFDTSPGSFGSTSASSFTQCLAACEATTKCVAVTYVGTACYFKKGFSSLISNPSASSAFMVNTQNYPVPASGNTKASSGCGSALPPGVQLGGSSTTFQITSNGVVRSFNVHVPTSYKNNKAVPLIVAYHGRSNNQLSVESDSQLSSETWNPYAISVYPLGINVSLGGSKGVLSKLTWTRNNGKVIQILWEVTMTTLVLPTIYWITCHLITVLTQAACWQPDSPMVEDLLELLLATQHFPLASAPSQQTRVRSTPTRQALATLPLC